MQNYNSKQHEWMLEVLMDLAAYAKKNDMPNLSDKVIEASLTYAQECGKYPVLVLDDSEEDSRSKPITPMFA